MGDIDHIIKELISRREQGKPPITLLAVCPNSLAVLEAAIRAAARNRSIMLFAATLNQVDFESSYTGWTPTDFVGQMHDYANKYHWDGPLYPCLDHGGPWLKDLHTLSQLSYPETMDKVKNSITACIQAGYNLLHIDTTVDRTLAVNQPLRLDLVVDRTVELMTHAELKKFTVDWSMLPGLKTF
jgi:tagatose-1,6-bisphosphate aldolase non-catalytic subunit AgaZ/GatZ